MPPALRTSLPTELAVENIRKENFGDSQECSLFPDEIVYAHIIREKIFVDPSFFGEQFQMEMLRKFRNTVSSKFPDIMFVYEVDHIMMIGHQHWFHVTGVGYKKAL